MCQKLLLVWTSNSRSALETAVSDAGLDGCSCVCAGSGGGWMFFPISYATVRANSSFRLLTLFWLSFLSRLVLAWLKPVGSSFGQEVSYPLRGES